TGYGTHMREFIAAARKLGCEVLPVILGGAEKAGIVTGEGKAWGMKRLLRAICPPYIWRSIKEFRLMKFDRHAEKTLEEAVEKFKPDLIYERSAWLQDSGALVAKKKNIRYCVEVNAPFPEEMREFENAGSWFEKVGKGKMRYQLSVADCLVVVSSALGNYLACEFKIDPSKIQVIPNAVDPQRFNVSPDDVNGFRAKYGLSNAKVLGFVGSIFPYHGVDKLIDAFATIAGEMKNLPLKLLIVGDGYLLPALKEQAVALGIEKDVIFTGPLPPAEIPVALSAMHIGIMAKTNWYGSPVKIFEYGAAGLQIIAPDTISVRDVMVPGEDGLLVSGKQDELKNAIVHLLTHEADGKRMANHFREKVLNQFTWEKSTMNTLKACGFRF
ncbi:MAG TPA: glycosyltransferase family 4 protein, partial [Bacteroidia bacterium]|nr:glycosyltransferase family 4 protein [Bacteroidia bacterium]